MLFRSVKRKQGKEDPIEKFMNENFPKLDDMMEKIGNSKLSEKIKQFTEETPLPSMFNKLSNEYENLKFDQNYEGENYPEAGNLINETYVSPPSVRENSTPATAAVRDDTLIFASVFNSSRVFV